MKIEGCQTLLWRSQVETGKGLSQFGYQEWAVISEMRKALQTLAQEVWLHPRTGCSSLGRLTRQQQGSSFLPSNCNFTGYLGFHSHSYLPSSNFPFSPMAFPLVFPLISTSVSLVHILGHTHYSPPQILPSHTCIMSGSRCLFIWSFK